jgi:DUF4097 and DUF4098 domain-containing protein YvlB
VVCQADIEVIVSEEIWADIQIGSGDVELRGLDKGAVVETGSGSITTSRVSGSITAETGSGDLNIEGGMGDLDLSTGSGSVQEQAAQATLLSLTAGSGDTEAEIADGLLDAQVSTRSVDVSLTIPAGADALDISTGLGDFELSEVTDSTAAERRLQISTGSGHVEVRGE